MKENTSLLVKKEKNERFMRKFHVENMMQVTEYTPDWKLYLSKQAILDDNERDELIRTIRNQMYLEHLTLEQLREIKKIISN